MFQLVGIAAAGGDKNFFAHRFLARLLSSMIWCGHLVRVCLNIDFHRFQTAQPTQVCSYVHAPLIRVTRLYLGHSATWPDKSSPRYLCGLSDM